MEVVKRVKPLKHFMLCDECQIGQMLPTNMVLTSYPEQYQHVCDKCGHIETYYKRYPYIEYIIDDYDYASMADVQILFDTKNNR